MHLRLEKEGGSFLLTSQPLARGGEAGIYEVPQRPRLVAKVYHQATAEHAAKVAAMIAAPPADPMAGTGHVSIAWPTDRLLDAAGRFLGYVMPRVDKVRPIVDFYHPQSRLQLCPLFHFGYLLRTARNLAAAVRAVHERGYIIGDLNESNLLVSNTALVTLVDTDSFQVPDRGTVYRCPVGKPEYTPPELQGTRFADFDRGPEHDAFALAVLIFQLLMQGIHPFAGRFVGQGEPAGLGERIAAGHWPYVQRRRVPYAPNPHAPPLEVLPAPVRDLMRRCFEDGHARSSLRPDAAAWLKAIMESEKGLLACPANPKQHVFHPGLKACPWCEMARRLGRDSFPSAEDVQAGRVGRRRPTARAPEVVQVPLAPAPLSVPVTGRDGVAVPVLSGPGPVLVARPSGSGTGALPVVRPSAPHSRPGSGPAAPPAAVPVTRSLPSDVPLPPVVLSGSRPSAQAVPADLADEDEPVPFGEIREHRPRWPWLAGAGGVLALAAVLLVIFLPGRKPAEEAEKKDPQTWVARKTADKKEGADKKDPAEKPAHVATNLFPKGPVRFLSELPEKDVRAGEWPFSKGTNGNGQPIRVNGILSRHGLGMHPPAHPGYASVRYELNKEAALFKATVAINDTTNWCFSPARFTVLGDGKELWQSKEITHTTGPAQARSQECQVLVKGVNWLELRVQVPNGNKGVEAVWVEPRVLQTIDTADPVGVERPDKAEPGESPLDPPVADFVRKAIEGKKYAQTAIVGSGFGRGEFEEVPPEGALLIGFELGMSKFGNDDIINSIQPIYRTAKGESRGAVRGTPTDRKVTLKARKGYAVGSVTVNVGNQLVAMRLTFMRVNKTYLDEEKAYAETAGNLGSIWGKPTTLDSNGSFVVGICGKNDPRVSRTLGLVLRRAGN